MIVQKKKKKNAMSILGLQLTIVLLSINLSIIFSDRSINRDYLYFSPSIVDSFFNPTRTCVGLLYLDCVSNSRENILLFSMFFKLKYRGLYNLKNICSEINK